MSLLVSICTDCKKTDNGKCCFKNIIEYIFCSFHFLAASEIVVKYLNYSDNLYYNKK